VLTVFGPPPFKYFVVVVSESDRELKIAEVVASLDLGEERGMDL
jgi:hypothetical protein